jgi:hypothetical protein
VGKGVFSLWEAAQQAQKEGSDFTIVTVPLSLGGIPLGSVTMEVKVRKSGGLFGAHRGPLVLDLSGAVLRIPLNPPYGSCPGVCEARSQAADVPVAAQTAWYRWQQHIELSRPQGGVDCKTKTPRP